MFVFIIPVKSAQLASDWAAFSKLFERTLKSVCNQKSLNFKVIVSCHELPEVEYQNEAVIYHQVDFDPPALTGNWDADVKLKEGDKANKLKQGYEKAKSLNPNYIMVVDADDLISNKIVPFVEKNMGNRPKGWFVKKGYYYREGANYLFVNTKEFYKLCGTCLVLRTDVFPQVLLEKPFLQYFHRLKELPDGSPLIPLPFAGALYSMGNGENHYMSVNQAVKLVNKPKQGGQYLKKLWHKMMKYRVKPLTGGFKKSFNFYKI